MKTFRAELTQFLRPNGRQKRQYTNLPINIQPLYSEMLIANCRLEAEVLMNNMVSITVSNGEEDIDISLTRNGPEVQMGMVAMLQRRRWTKPKQSDQNP